MILSISTGMIYSTKHDISYTYLADDIYPSILYQIRMCRNIGWNFQMKCVEYLALSYRSPTYTKSKFLSIVFQNHENIVCN